jgi:cupin fold WbuC family metalloprotein
VRKPQEVWLQSFKILNKSERALNNIFSSNLVRQDKQARSLSYFFTDEVAWIDHEMINQLKEHSQSNSNCNVRISLHTSPGAAFHEMVILEHSGGFYRPHKHLHKGESCHIIEGAIAMFRFGEDGSVENYWVLDEKENYIARVSANHWHTVFPLSDYVIYHESKPGPFLKDKDSIYPDWAPDGTDPEKAEEYMQSLKQIAKGINNQGFRDKKEL